MFEDPHCDSFITHAELYALSWILVICEFSALPLHYICPSFDCSCSNLLVHFANLHDSFSRCCVILEIPLIDATFFKEILALTTLNIIFKLSSVTLTICECLHSIAVNSFFLLFSYERGTVLTNFVDSSCDVTTDLCLSLVCFRDNLRSYDDLLSWVIVCRLLELKTHLSWFNVKILFHVEDEHAVTLFEWLPHVVKINFVNLDYVLHW